MFYLHFEQFAREFLVLTFDYQMQYADNVEFSDAVSELFKELGEKVWLVGQSLGVSYRKPRKLSDEQRSRQGRE